MKHHELSSNRADALLLVTAMIWGLAFTAQRSGMAVIGPFAFSAARFALGGLALLPFLIATIIRFIQGSGTVAMITAASITAPIIANMSVNPVFAALAACVGSLFYSYFNDSFFWVVNRSIGITEGREQLRLYSVASTIAWVIGIVVLLILNALFG